MSVRSTAVLVLGVVMAGTVGMVSPGAAAETGEGARATLTAANQATRTMAQTGVDIVQQVTFNQRADLSSGFNPVVDAVVPARSRVRVHATVNPDDAFYLSVRRQPGTKLLGATGRQVAEGRVWATVSMLPEEDAATARSHGAVSRTAITDMYALPDYLADWRLAESPWDSAMRLLLPPYSGSGDEGWTTVDATPQADGSTLISGTIDARPPASDGEDACVRPLVEINVGPDLIARWTHWIETCPGLGTREFRSTATYGGQPIQEPTRPRMSAARALR